MKATILATLLFLSAFSLFAQNGYSIKGSVADTATKAKLVNTLITVLNSKDSTLVKFGRAATDGTFSLNLAKGNFILLVTYPAYADYVAKFDLDSVNAARNFSQINLTLKARLLEEIVINGTAAITIKGDTTVFSTSSLKIQPNSNVEDLIKQLPGIQVDQNGKITAHGQAVNKVLVDGEEFFGDDPTLVTKNIRGDMVKSFELFDKKSDQAAFTGIDDGIKTKTLNVVLKDNSKNGYFGKIDLGATANNYYQGQGMFNQFNSKRKFAAYGTLGNTGKTGLGFDDVNKYGGGSNNVQFTGGALYISPSGDELESFSGRYDGRGFPVVRSGGVHFDSKWNKDKESINVNYKIGSMNVDGIQNTITQNNLPSGFIKSNANQNYGKYVFRQKLDLTYEVKLNSTTTLKISADGTLKNGENHNKNITINERNNNTQLNTGDRALSTTGDQKTMNANVFLAKKMKKDGRTISININEAFNTNDTKGFLSSINNFYDSSGTKLDSTQAIDQYKTTIGKSSVLASNVTWSEPLSKTFSVVLNYGLAFRDETLERQSFNKSIAGKYDLLDQQFSNNLELNQIGNLAGAIFNYSKKKTILNFGTRLSQMSYNQTDVNSKKEYKMNFVNWTPQARYQYKFSSQANLSIDYSGSTTQPTINQIQPIQVNDDPLNITLGNPELRPSFRNSFSAAFFSNKQIAGRSSALNANYAFISNSIIGSRFIDAAGKTTYQDINIDKAASQYSFGGFISQNIKNTSSRVALNFNTYGSTYFSYINSVLNTSKTGVYSVSLNVSSNKVKKYSLYFSVGPRYNTTKSSVLSEFNDRNWALSTSTSLTFYLPGKVEITSDARYAFTENTRGFSQSINPLIWNSSVSKKFFKKENLKFSISGSDLLNQNVGFNRSAYTQSSYSTIQRYFMGSLTWDFTKMGGAAAAQK